MSDQRNAAGPRAKAGMTRRPYEKPSISRVELTLEETLSGGCKLVTDFMCVGPPAPSFDEGS